MENEVFSLERCYVMARSPSYDLLNYYNVFQQLTSKNYPELWDLLGKSFREEASEL